MKKLYFVSFRILSITALFFLSLKGESQYLVNFEGTGETKTAYASGNVILSGIPWNLSGALIGTLTTDRKEGLRSARVQAGGTLTMLADKSNGLGSLSIQHASFGTDGVSTWKVEYSIDGGSNWLTINGIITTISTTLIHGLAYDCVIQRT